MGGAQRRIAPYANGYVPTGRLIVFGSGQSPVDGYFEWRLPRATLRRLRALIARAKARTGRTLTPSQGWSTDRPYHIQVLAKKIHGILAATPGRSSHGGVFEGAQTMAVDLGNWAWVYQNHGGYAAFEQDFRAEGFAKLPAGRYPREDHHIIDYNPWDDEPEFGGVALSGEEEDMPLTDAEIERIAERAAYLTVTYPVRAQDRNGNNTDEYPFSALMASAAAQARAAVADINYIHQVSPVSLYAIREAQGSLTLSDEQARALSDRLAAAAVESLDMALRDDFDAVRARLSELPTETIAALKAAL